MFQKRWLLFTVALLGLNVLCTELRCQDLTPNCRKFQELMAQKGLAWSTEVREQPLMPGQLLNPVLIVTNKSDTAIEIPQLKPFRHFSVEQLTRVFDEKLGQNVYKSIRHHPRKENELMFCKNDTDLIFPQETKEFYLGGFPGQLLHDSEGDLEIVLIARPEIGEQRYVLHLGRFSVEGFYNVEAATVLDYTCVLRPISPKLAEDRGLKDDPRPYCQPFVIAKSTVGTFLLAGVRSGIVEGYDYALRERQRETGPLGDLELLKRSALRLTEVSEDTRFGVSQSSAAIPLSELTIVSGGKRLDATAIEQTFQRTKKPFTQQ